MSSEQDLPYLDDSIVKLPSDIRDDLAERGRRDLFFFASAILGMRDLTESCHGPLCAFSDLNPAQFKMYLMPRDHLKTSLKSIAGNMQKVVQNPEERILIANESATNAGRMLRSIRQHAEGNRVFRALYSASVYKDTRKVRWNDAELDFVREGHWPEPTIDSIGMTGAVTSRHYTHIGYDDPISEEAVKSEKVMADTISRMGAALSLLVDPSKNTIDLTGTRWALHDTYSWWQREFGTKLAVFARSAIEDGQPIWPERFSLETLALKRKMMGEYKFSCLMMNKPRNTALQDLNIDDVMFWEWSGDEQEIILFDRQGQETRRCVLDDLDITCTVDPASAEKTTSDRNAVVTVGVTPWNQALVLDAWGSRCNALQLINYLYEVKKRFNPRVFGIEDSGYQKVLKVFLRQFADDRGIYFNIQPLPSKGKKPVRIRGLQPYLATGRIFINAQQHLLRNEMSDFPLGEHDDVLDALSMHIMLWRGQMSPEARGKYRDEEQKLVARILRQNTSPYTLFRDVDPEEVPDEFDRPQIPIKEYFVA